MANFIEPSVRAFLHAPYLEMELLEGKKVFKEPEHPVTIPQFIEQIGRTCYKSEDRIEPGTDEKFVRMLRKRGHHAMLEHAIASAHLICNRGVTHELVRHRIASFAQESTRYCDYAPEGRQAGVTFIIPPELSHEPDHKMVSDYDVWVDAMENSEISYNSLRDRGQPPEIARGVLPIDLKTEI